MASQWPQFGRRDNVEKDDATNAAPKSMSVACPTIGQAEGERTVGAAPAIKKSASWIATSSPAVATSACCLASACDA
jgi:hypothetical protein